MKIEYSILAAFIALVYVTLTQFFPDFPLDAPTLLAFLVYVLLKLGVEVVGKPVYHRFMNRH